MNPHDQIRLTESVFGIPVTHLKSRMVGSPDLVKEAKEQAEKQAKAVQDAVGRWQDRENNRTRLGQGWPFDDQGRPEE